MLKPIHHVDRDLVKLPNGAAAVVVGRNLSGWVITEQIEPREYGDLGRLAAHPDEELRPYPREQHRADLKRQAAALRAAGADGFRS